MYASCNTWRLGVAIVALDKQQVLKIMIVSPYYCLNAKRMHHAVGCDMSGSTAFSHYPASFV